MIRVCINEPYKVRWGRTPGGGGFFGKGHKKKSRKLMEAAKLFSAKNNASFQI